MQKTKKAIKTPTEKTNSLVQTKWLKVGPDTVLTHGNVQYNIRCGWCHRSANRCDC